MTEGEPLRRRLAAILAADIAGYSRLMGQDETATVRDLKGHQAAILPLVGRHGGHVIDTAGDGILAEFPSVVGATECAIEIQAVMAARNANVPEQRRMLFRIGINLGDVVHDEARIYGDGINVAARLGTLAAPGGVLVSHAVHEQVRDRLALAFEDLGEQELKNIARPVRAYRLQAPGEPTAPTPTLTLPEKPSIAVLPFANMSDDPEQGYFADGIAEDTLTELSHVRWLFVIARQSSFSYKGRAVDVKQIGRELGVRYIVEGSVRKAGNRVRIVAQLIEAETSVHIWADRFEGDLSDVFALQDEITGRIVSAIEPSVQASEIRRVRTKPTESLTAYDLYLRALPEYYGQTPETYKRAREFLRKAIETDPEYAEALGTLTDSIATGTLEGFYGDWTRGTMDACQIAARAVAAGPENSTCLASAAFAYAVLASRFDEAHALADRALMLHPNSAFVRNRIGPVYIVCGESDKAIAQYQAARNMDPFETKKTATATFSGLAAALFFARRFEECLDAGRHALSFTPMATTARRYVAGALAQLGRIEEAQAEIAELLKYYPDASLALFRRHPFRYAWMLELILESLRKAGLREE